MNEDKLNTLRQQDTNLRDAISLDEAERPQMPADLNERLMKRIANEERKKPRRIIWPWIAAACVAGVMIIWLTPPKDIASPPTPLQEARGVVTPEIHKTEEPKVEEPVVAKVETKTVSWRTPRVKKDRIIPITPTTQSAEPTADLAAVKEVSTPLPSGEGQGGGSAVTLTERDIPITRPENYKYTPEELALMKKQANEAYLKWVKLELEIAKHNLEQTAQSDF